MMKKATQLIGLLWLFLQGSAQQIILSDLEDAKRIITAENDLYFQAFALGNSSLLTSQYMGDCWILAPDRDIFCGVNAPLEYFRTNYDQLGIRGGRLLSIDIFGEGKEFITELGFWQTFNGQHEKLDGGYFMMLWKKTESGWKICRQFFASDQALQTNPPFNKKVSKKCPNSKSQSSFIFKQQNITQ